MILRLDRVGVALPPPSDPDPAGAAAVQAGLVSDESAELVETLVGRVKS